MMKIVYFMAINLLLVGCHKQYRADDGYIPETITIDTTETKNINFFPTSDDFNLCDADVTAMSNLFKEALSDGIDNIGFMLVSDKAIPFEVQEEAKKKISFMMGRHGFLDSRIVDSGACVYKGAKTGVRIDLLKYDTNEPDCSKWSEYIGDIDTNKNLPKYGAASAYNFLETIGNKADLISPRKYKGQDVTSAVKASQTESGASTGGGESSSSSAAAAAAE
jgi:type IV pilus biogenesis protein CpaD/CtpE